MSELSLAEWCGQLPVNHKVNLELRSLRMTIGLLNSMVCCGEEHTDTSMAEVKAAMRIIHGE